MAQDRPDVQYAVKEAARRMASPCEEDWILLKRLGRYLAGSPRVIYRLPWQSTPTGVDTYTDSDWAGCKGTRRSTSGGGSDARPVLHQVMVVYSSDRGTILRGG